MPVHRLVPTVLLCVVISLVTLAHPTNKAASGKAAQARKSGPESEIRAVLDAQVAAWNAGKIEEFMKGYWRSQDLSFFSGGTKLSGWDSTLERYRKNYQSEGREMGRLQFTIYDISLLGRDAAFVRGRYELTFSKGGKPSGLFTLIFRRFNDGWKIVHDHTSGNPS